MKIAFVLLLSLLAITNQAQTSSKPKLSPQQAIADADFIFKLFIEAHTDLTLVTDTQYLRFRFDTLKAGITDSISASQLYTRIAPVFSSIKDIHCALILPEQSNDYYQAGGLYLPIRVYFDNDTLRLLSDQEDTLPAGKRIISINNIPVNEISKTLLSISASEGDNVYSRRRYAALLFPMVFPLFFSVDSINILTLADSADSTDFFIAGIDRKNSFSDSFFSSSGSSEDPFQFGYTYDKTFAYMRIASFMGGNPGEYRRFLLNAFRHIRKSNPKGLILDLRTNGGGFTEYGKLLLRYLMPSEFKYIDHIVTRSSFMIQRELLRESSFQPEITRFLSKSLGNKVMRSVWNKQNKVSDTLAEKLVKPKSENLVYNGFLVVMMNGFSASTTGLVCNTLKMRSNTIFTGEPAGCTIAGTFGQPTVFELPNSGIRGYISILRFNQHPDLRSMEPIMPDIWLDDKPALDSTDTDLGLKSLLEYLKQKKQ